jgi:hypothetical protein
VTQKPELGVKTQSRQLQKRLSVFSHTGFSGPIYRWWGGGGGGGGAL